MARFIPHWRKMSWAIAIWTLLMGAWLIGGVGGAASGSCAGMTGDQLAACQAGTAIGGGIAATFIIFIWFMGFVVLSLVWFMTRPRAARG